MRTVIDLIASAGGYQVIFTPEVGGVVSISVVDRPWEDALATVLRAKQLREVRHEDIMLVSPARARSRAATLRPDARAGGSGTPRRSGPRRSTRGSARDRA